MTVLSLSNGGAFATARRGGLTFDDVAEIKRLRSGPRPLSWQHLAARYGRSVHDLMVAAGAIELPPPPPKPTVVIPAQPVTGLGRKPREFNAAELEILYRVERREQTVYGASRELGIGKTTILGWLERRANAAAQARRAA